MILQRAFQSGHYLQEVRGYSLTMAGTLLMISTLAGMLVATRWQRAIHNG